MNSCILMAEITQDPQLRYTSDNQTPLAEMQVQIPSLRAEEAPESLKVVVWGNLAQEVQEQYRGGDRVILEGRLGMVMVEQPEGFKEKRAELTIQRIHRAGSEDIATHRGSASQVAAPAAPVEKPRRTPAKRRTPVAAVAATSAAIDVDEIPF